MKIFLTWRWVDSDSIVNCTPRDLGNHEPELDDRVLLEVWLAS